MPPTCKTYVFPTLPTAKAFRTLVSKLAVVAHLPRPDFRTSGDCYTVAVFLTAETSQAVSALAAVARNGVEVVS